MGEEDEATRTNVLEVAREVATRRKWLAIFVFGGVFAAVVSIVRFLPDVYRSSATVLIERQQIPDQLVRSTVTSELETRLQTISQEILSRGRLEALIDRFGLYPDIRKKVPLEQLIERMRGEIQLDLKGSERRTDRAMVAFKISFTSRDPHKAALVANTLTSFYIEENLKARERQAAGTAEFLRVQLEQMRQKLEVQEKHVTTFKERHIGELPQQMEANLATLEQLNGQLRLNSDNQIQLSERRTALLKQLEESEGSGPPGGSKATAERLAELHKQLTALRTRFSDKYPDVVRAKSEIASLEEQLRKTEEGGEAADKATPATPHVLQLRQALTELDLRAKTFAAEAESLRHTLALYQTRVENAPRREQEFQGLSRDYETTKELYRSLLVRQREAELAESMEQRQKGEQFRVIDPATASEEPTAPKRGRMIVMGFLLSLGLALGAVILAEQLDTSFHAVDDLRRAAAAPVLISLPRIVTQDDARERRWRFGLATVSAALSLGLIVGTSYLLANENGPLAAWIQGSSER
jgi:polysaccharide chain length determinant protein (PEP-CTERM system associated)